VAIKTALITGITGQDGSFLAELLLEKGYAVYGTSRNTSPKSCTRIDHLKDRIQMVAADLLDQNSLIQTLEQVQPDEIYNLAAHSFVPASWEQPVETGDFSALGVTRLLEAIRKVNRNIHFYQASSSEMFGKSHEHPQNEASALCPRSPYGVAKVYGHLITMNYRETHGLYACSGILFNHESERRGLEFLPRKVTHGAARIKLGLESELHLGSLESRRDWGYARDYVEAMWLMLQQPEPDDFVIASGKTHSVQDLVEAAFTYLGLDWQRHVVIDPAFVRPPESYLLVGDASKAERCLGWTSKTSFQELVKLMVDADLKGLSRQGQLPNK
jgi:GDPmannose 4,6-dehydratase